MSRKTDRKAIAKLDALYAQLPRISCRGLCGVACGPVPMTTVEAARLQKADVDRRAPSTHQDAACVYLTARQRCAVYQVRPLICRVFGLVKRLSCMHGCLPERWVTDEEFVRLAQAVERAGGPIVVTTPDGLVPGETFMDLDPNWIAELESERLANHTRALRAIHGGRIFGVTHGGPGGVIELRGPVTRAASEDQ